MTTRLVLASGEAQPHTVTVPELLAHYERAGFLYPEKRKRIAALMPEFEARWPKLLTAADDLFMMDVMRVDGVVRVSHALCRLSATTMAAHHAANEGVPGGLFEPLSRQLIAATAIDGVRFVTMFVRPTNRWAGHIARVADSVTLQGHPGALERAYLAARPADLPPYPTGRAEAVSPVDAVATADFAKAVWGTERAIGRGATDVGWDSSITVLYATAGIGHERRMWAVVRGSHIVGLALRTVLSTPLNFSLLDRRAEIVVAAGLSDRERVVTDLAHAVIADARAHGEPIVPLMIEATDAPAAMAAGFADDGMSYVEHLWPVTAAAEGVAAFRQLYTGRTRRHGMQAGAVA